MVKLAVSQAPPTLPLKQQSKDFKTDFFRLQYAGLWHSIAAYPAQFGASGSCTNALYTLRDGFVEVFNTQVVNQRLVTINGTATLVPSTDGSAKLTVRFAVGSGISK